jgi:hypothetical protein
LTSKLDAAQALAARGFKVFPIAAGKKAPPLWKDWPEKATTEVAQWPENANIGIHAKGYIVIDVDPAKGGDKSLSELELAYGLPRTLVTRTPTGGRHLFYRSGAAVSNSVGALGAGLDIRSAGGYVLATGSEVKAGRYRFEADTPIADAPDWLVLKLGTIIPKTSTTAEPVPDAPEAVVERAGSWLAQQDPAIEGQGGDARTYAVACGLRDLGVSEAQALTLLLEYWNDRCSPPWTPQDLEIRVGNAYRYAQNEPGAAAALPDDFPVVQDSALYTDRVQAKKVYKAARLSQFANSEIKGPGYLVKGLLQRRSYAVGYGAPGEGKTFIFLDLAYHIAAGLPWMGHKVHGGLVLYLAYEGTGGMVKRAQALRHKYGHKDVPLYIASASFNLREKDGRQALGAIIAELPAKPVLIVVDTLARALMGGDENSAQDVGAFNSAVAALIDATGACVTVIHHSGKNKQAGARGSSALLGAIDTELEVDGGRVTASKQRDVEMGEPTGFKLTPVIVGLDEDGDELTSCVVDPDTVVQGPKGRLAGNAKRGFDVLCELRPDNTAITAAEWQEGCRDFLGTKSVAQRFYDLKKVLLRRGFIVVDNDDMITRRCE